MIGFGGTDRGARISGGVQLDYGLASGATIFAGSQVVENGGVGSGTVVLNGGTLEVQNGAVQSGTVVSSGAWGSLFDGRYRQYYSAGGN